MTKTRARTRAEQNSAQTKHNRVKGEHGRAGQSGAGRSMVEQRIAEENGLNARARFRMACRCPILIRHQPRFARSYGKH